MNGIQLFGIPLFANATQLFAFVILPILIAITGWAIVLLIEWLSPVDRDKSKLR